MPSPSFVVIFQIFLFVSTAHYVQQGDATYQHHLGDFNPKEISFIQWRF